MKILIIRFSSIGDIVLTTPVVRCLKQQLGAEVHYLTKRFFGTILAANPNIDKVWTIEDKVSEVLRELEKEGFDYVIDLHKNIRSLQVRRSLSAKVLAFDKLNWEKWLMVNLKWNRLPDTHIVDRYLAPLSEIGLKNDGLGLDYFIPSEEEVDIEKRYDLKNGFIAFAIGAAHATKRLPKGKIISICQKTNKAVFLLGGPAEKKIGEEIAQAAGRHIINTCGSLSLHQSASIVRQSNLVITHDTGMMHIAAAFQKKIISVWGNTIPEFGMYPYLKSEADHILIENKNLSCRPCSKIGYATCPKGHFKCMNEIDEAAIIEAIGDKF